MDINKFIELIRERLERIESDLELIEWDIPHKTPFIIGKNNIRLTLSEIYNILQLYKDMEDL